MIREARTEDALTIVGMIKTGSDEGVFHSRCDSLEEQVEGFRRYAFESRPKGYNVLVHQTENRIEGYLDYRVNRGVGCIWGIYVKPNCRRKGVGRNLMKKAFEDFNRIGCHKARLEVFARNVGAISFHEHLGFKQEGFLHRDEDQKDIIIMSRFFP